MVAPAGLRITPQDPGLEQALIRPEGGIQTQRQPETQRIEAEQGTDETKSVGSPGTGTYVARAEPSDGGVRAEIGNSDSKEAYATKARTFRGIGSEGSRNAVGPESASPRDPASVPKDAIAVPLKQEAGSVRDNAPVSVGLTTGAGRDPGASATAKVPTPTTRSQ